ncbi:MULTISPECIES: hypothetical protein [Agrobacterium]|uniref:hypothetical protein n=1 Tax=Agrobacterium TaxID=357 RepID=UPI0015739172|nr:hypothetical protein [Agrobacterium tumefaciens]
MNTKFIATFIVLASTATSAFATGTLSESAGPVDRIVQGHGRPGESAVASSDRSVTFEVLADGRVRRTNAKYGTVTISNPAAEALRARGRR